MLIVENFLWTTTVIELMQNDHVDIKAYNFVELKIFCTLATHANAKRTTLDGVSRIVLLFT